MKKIQYVLSLVCLMMVFSPSLANNILVSNVSLLNKNTTNHQMEVSFDLAWENAWANTSVGNHDAAWVFIKFRVGNNPWSHAFLNNTGHTAPAGTQVDPGLRLPDQAYASVSNPVLGVFVAPVGPFSGHFSASGIRLLWNYGDNGVADNDLVQIKIFAIEMVYVPTGSFFLGSTGNEYGRFVNVSTWSAYSVLNEEEIVIASTLGYYDVPGSGDGQGPIPAVFPKGYNAFYCMKYEITQQQYVDFLNTLMRDQQNTRTRANLATGITAVSNTFVMCNHTSPLARNGIRCDAVIHSSDPLTFYCDLNVNGIEGEDGDGQCLPVNYLNWSDGAAFSDWSGLRPMTELEFEKACRGTAAPLFNEFAWGTALAKGATSPYTISNAGHCNEEIATNYESGTQTGNILCGTSDLPGRVGIFASHANNTGTDAQKRINAGASYWGIMNLSGNLKERCVSVGNPAGRSFTGLHGDGLLNSAGDATTDYWPGINGNAVITVSNGVYGGVNGVTEAAGSGFRGSSFGFGQSYARTSDRFHANFTSNFSYEYYGFRAVRTAVIP